jgi:hypothetical protein
MPAIAADTASMPPAEAPITTILLEGKGPSLGESA